MYKNDRFEIRNSNIIIFFIFKCDSIYGQTKYLMNRHSIFTVLLYVLIIEEWARKKMRVRIIVSCDACITYPSFPPLLTTEVKKYRNVVMIARIRISLLDELKYLVEYVATLGIIFSFSTIVSHLWTYFILLHKHNVTKVLLFSLVYV